MVAPTPEQVLKHLKEVAKVRIITFTDLGRREQSLHSFCKLADNDELQQSALVQFFTAIDKSFGVFKDEDGAILGYLTAAVILKEKGYILYLKFNAGTKKVDIYSVSDGFLALNTQQHNWYINNPACLTTPWKDISDKEEFIYNLDVEHQFPPSVRRTETALEIRLEAFNTEVLYGAAIASEDSFEYYPSGETITMSLLDDKHLFGSVWFNENIINRNVADKAAEVNSNSLLMVGHGGIGIIYNYINQKTYIANKILTKSFISGN